MGQGGGGGAQLIVVLCCPELVKFPILKGAMPATMPERKETGQGLALVVEHSAQK